MESDLEGDLRRTWEAISGLSPAATAPQEKVTAEQAESAGQHGHRRAHASAKRQRRVLWDAVRVMARG